MNLEVDYEVLGEHFNFSGYSHSFYSPHFSVNLQKADDHIRLFFKIYPKQIRFKYIKIYIKLPSTVGRHKIIFSTENQVLIQNNSSFVFLFSSYINNSITTFSLKGKYVIANTHFFDKIFKNNETKILDIKSFFGAINEVVKSYSEDFGIKRSNQYFSAWRFIESYYKKPSSYNSLSLIQTALNSNLNFDYLFLNDFIDDSDTLLVNENISRIKDKNVLPAIEFSPFLVSKNSSLYNRLSKNIFNFDSKHLYSDYRHILDPRKSETKDFITKKVDNYLKQGISAIKFSCVSKLLSIKPIAMDVLTFLKDLIISIKSANPRIKIITDLPYCNFFCNGVNFVEINDFVEYRGSIFKSFKINRDKIFESLFYVIINKNTTSISLSHMGFSLPFLNEKEIYFISIISYLFSNVFNFNINVSNYTREEVTISKKMIHIYPKIEYIHYENGFLKVDFITDDQFVAYINVSNNPVKLDFISLEPFSLVITDLNRNIRRWPFIGW